MTSQNIWDDLWGSPEPEVPIKSSYNSVHLAQYFQQELLATSWYKGFGIVNLRALASQIAKWKGKVTADQVRAMVDLYMASPKHRSTNASWQDFVYRRDELAASLLETEEKTQVVDNYAQRMEEYDEEAELAAYLERRKRGQS